MEEGRKRRIALLMFLSHTHRIKIPPGDGQTD